MKKKFILFSLLLCSFAKAQKNIQTPFWQTLYSEPVVVQMQPVQQGIEQDLEQDCKEYGEYLLKQSEELTAEDLDFARTLPLPKQMKDNYEVDFRFTNIDSAPMSRKTSSESTSNLSANLSAILNYQVENPLVGLELSSLKNIKAPIQDGTLSAISKKFSLAAAPIVLLKDPSGATTALKIKGRDAVCDLLNKKIALSAEAQYVISLPADNIIKMNRFHARVEDKTAPILNLQENSLIKAAMLGYEYSQLFKEENIAESEMQQNIHFLFKNLFNENTLDLSENWVQIGGRKVIHFDKSKTANYGPVQLRM